MKKIIALLMLLTIALSLMVGCGDKEETYSVAIATDSSFGKGGKVTNVGLILVIDSENKIVAARFDSAEPAAKLDDAGALVVVEAVDTKVELGDAYTGMPAGAWYKQAAVFCKAIVGMTSTELEAFEPVSDALAAAGCTMQNTPAGYKTTLIKAVSTAR